MVCGLPEDDESAHVWRLYIGRRGPGSWAVVWLGKCLSKSGKWDDEMMPSSRTDAWIKRHRFTLEEATRLAVKHYPKLIINGMRVENGKLVQA